MLAKHPPTAEATGSRVVWTRATQICKEIKRVIDEIELVSWKMSLQFCWKRPIDSIESGNLLKSSLPFGCRRGRRRGHGGWAWPARWRWRWWGRKWCPRWEPKAGQRWQPADGRSSSVSRWTKRTKCARWDRIRGRHPVQPEHLQSSTAKANEIQFIIAGFIHQRDAKTRLLIEIFLAANNFLRQECNQFFREIKSFSVHSSDTWWSCQNVRDDGR